MRYVRLVALFGMALGAVVVFSGCGAKVPIGPYPVTVYLGEGQIDPVSFLPLPGKVAFDGTIEEDFCGLPTEEEVGDVLSEVGDLDLSSLVEITEMDLQNITLTATSGDFSAITEMVITYLPKPIDGVEQAGVELGRASSASGFGSTIVLTPTVSVDLLSLIRENDNNPAEGCPKLEIYVAGDVAVMKQAISWQAEANVDVYALLG